MYVWKLYHFQCRNLTFRSQFDVKLSRFCQVFDEFMEHFDFPESQGLSAQYKFFKQPAEQPSVLAVEKVSLKTENKFSLTSSGIVTADCRLELWFAFLRADRSFWLLELILRVLKIQNEGFNCLASAYDRDLKNGTVIKKILGFLLFCRALSWNLKNSYLSMIDFIF